MENNKVDNKEDVTSEGIHIKARHGYIDSKYKLQMESPIEGLSSEFAKAYPVTGGEPNLYALLFDNNFPVRLHAVEALKKISHVSIQQVVDCGKIIMAATKTERFAVVLEKPVGKRLSDIVVEGKPYNEDFVKETIIEQLVNALEVLTENEIVHGTINPNTVYYQEETGRVLLRECIADFCGFSQMPDYDALDQLLCHPAGKGDKDFAGDYFQLGMIVLFLLTAKRPFDTSEKKKIIETRLERGSCDATISRMSMAAGVQITSRMSNLLKGLLTDHTNDRWKAKEIRIWLKRRETAAPPLSRLHKRTSISTTFDEKEYYSRKYLAYDICEKWNVAKRTLKILDLSRWMSLALKRRKFADALNDLAPVGETEVILPDEKIARIIVILDPYGPLRLRDFTCSIFGIGTLLSYYYLKSDREGLQNLGLIFRDGLVEYWIRMQPDPEYYGYGTLSWTPRVIREYMHKKPLGFGMERCLYDLNSSLSCQSPIIGNNHVTNLAELMLRLEKLSTTLKGDNREETDPIDRHIAAFIASRIDLEDDMRVKSLQNFPYVGKNPQIIMLAFLTVSQVKSGIATVKGIASWMNNRLVTLLDTLHSRLIRKEIQSKLDAATKTGQLNNMFQVVANPLYARRDLYGFHEARNQYHALAAEIAKLKKQSNIQRLAYQFGLRISVTASSLVCIATLLYVMYKAGSG